MASAMVDGWVRADPARASRIVVSDRGSGRAGRLGGAARSRRRGFEPRPGRARGHRGRRGQADRRRARAARGVRPDHARARGAVGGRRRRDDDARDDRRRGRPGVPRHAERRRARVRGHPVLRRGPVRRWGRRGGRARVARAARHRRAARGAAVRRGDGARRVGSCVPRPRHRGVRGRGHRLGPVGGEGPRAGPLDDGGHRRAARCVRDVVLRSASHRHLTRGTAAAGLAQMERAGVRSGIIDGVLAALRRAAELG